MMLTRLKDYLFGTDRPPERQFAPRHVDVEHQHWDPVTRTWVEHPTDVDSAA